MITSKKLYSNIRSKNYFFDRKNKDLKINGNKYQDRIIKNTIEGINVYLWRVKSYSGSWCDDFQYCDNDKGYNRAESLKLILISSLPKEFKIFAIDTVISEKNGAKLKAEINKQLPNIKLKQLFPTKYLANNNLLVKMQKELLTKIHGRDNGHTYSEKICDEFWDYKSLNELQRADSYYYKKPWHIDPFAIDVKRRYSFYSTYVMPWLNKLAKLAKGELSESYNYGEAIKSFFSI